MKRWFAGIFLLFALAPAFAFASTLPINTNVWNISILKGPLVVCGAPQTLSTSGATANTQATTVTVTDSNGNSTTITNPPGCQDLCDLFAELIQILYFIIGVGIWIVIPLMFLWAGISIMLARGNPAKVSDARKAATGALIGVLIMLCAWLLVNTFVGILNLTNIGGFNSSGSCVAPPASQTGS